MPRLINRNPSYRKHRPSGQAVVTLGGKDVYLGPHGTKASRDEYDRVIAEWLANGRRLPAPGGVGDLSIAELTLAYWKHAEGYYDGENQGELACTKGALKVLRTLYGRTTIADFGPLALKAVRGQMLELGWCRSHINAQVGRIRRMFRWGVEMSWSPRTRTTPSAPALACAAARPKLESRPR